MTLQFRGLYQKVVHKRPVQEDCVVISLFPVLFSYLFEVTLPPLRLKGWERDHSFRETTQGSLGRILTSEAPVTTSMALVPSSFLLLLVRHLLLLAWHLFLVASCYY